MLVNGLHRCRLVVRYNQLWFGWFFFWFSLAQRRSESSVTKTNSQNWGKVRHMGQQNAGFKSEATLEFWEFNRQIAQNTRIYKWNCSDKKSSKTTSKHPKSSCSDFILKIARNVALFSFNKMYPFYSSHQKQVGRGMIYFGGISYIWPICIWPEHMDCIWH